MTGVGCVTRSDGEEKDLWALLGSAIAIVEVAAANASSSFIFLFILFYLVLFFIPREDFRARCRTAVPGGGGEFFAAGAFYLSVSRFDVGAKKRKQTPNPEGCDVRGSEEMEGIVLKKKSICYQECGVYRSKSKLESMNRIEGGEKKISIGPKSSQPL